MSPAGFEHFEVEADVGVRAWGPTRAEAFAQAALGVLALIVAPDGVEARGLYVHEIEGFVARRVEVDACGDTLLHGVLHGEALDARRHRLGAAVKAATLHRVSVGQREGRHEVSLVVGVCVGCVREETRGAASRIIAATSGVISGLAS
ncbi:MAG: archease [Candidatus Rokubacteria bacterium]|nr:archease [Candidatus Rokubacteria bacterium]